MEHLNPLIVNDIVLSVPHSGTRTLQRWLKNEKGIVRNTQPDPDEMVGHWHFGMHQNKIDDMGQHGHGFGHIALRNPVDVSDSWRRRYKDEPAKGQSDVNRAIQLMMDYAYDYESRVKIYKIEDLPNLIGAGPDNHLSREELYNHPRIVDLRNWFQNDNVVTRFYLCYYTPSELWWL